MKKEISSKHLVPVIKMAVDEGKTVKFTVKGNSMYPLLVSERDKVLVSKADSFKKGDIVLYQRDKDEYVFHRIIKKDDGNKILTMCGDNETNLEYNVAFETVIAKAVSFERKGKMFSVKNVFYRIYSCIWTNFVEKRRIILRTLIFFYKKIKKI